MHATMVLSEGVGLYSRWQGGLLITVDPCIFEPGLFISKPLIIRTNTLFTAEFIVLTICALHIRTFGISEQGSVLICEWMERLVLSCLGDHWQTYLHNKQQLSRYLTFLDGLDK